MAMHLQLSCEELPYDLVSQAKTDELQDGCARDPWERLTSDNRKCSKRTLSRLLVVALRMYLTLHLLLFAQSM